MRTIETISPDAPTAARIVRDYLADVASRWYGRPATDDEVDQALLDEPFDDLQGDTGALFVAFEDGHPVGCAGVRSHGGLRHVRTERVRPDQRLQRRPVLGSLVQQGRVPVMDVTDVATRLLERSIERGQAVLGSSVRAAAAARHVHVRTGVVGDVLALALADAALWDVPAAEMRKLLEAPAAANEVA